MRSKNDIIKMIGRCSNEIGIHYDKETDKVLHNEDNSEYCTMDEFYRAYLKQTGQSFEVVRKDMGDRLEVIRCKECGTVIFVTGDEDLDLRCPTCTDYITPYEHYTKVDLSLDEEKAKRVRYYERWQKDVDERNERMKTKGLNINEIATKVIERGNKRYTFSLRCNDIRKSKLKGLYFYYRSSTMHPETGYYFVTSQIRIPLSWSHFYTHVLKRQPMVDLEDED